MEAKDPEAVTTLSAQEVHCPTSNGAAQPNGVGAAQPNGVGAAQPNGVGATRSREDEDGEVHSEKDAEDQYERPLAYKINDSCPIYLAVLYSIQFLMADAGLLLGVAYMVHSAVCGGDDKVLFAQLVSSFFFLSGVGTVLQATVGVRLPIVQGSSFAYIGPVMAMMSSDKWSPCRPRCLQDDLTVANTTTTDSSSISCVDEPWRKPLLEISGSLMCAAAVQMVLGMTGMAGFLLNYMSSLTIGVTVSLLGLSVVPIVGKSAQTQWGIALLTTGLYILFAQILAPLHIPLPTYIRGKGVSFKKVPIFRLFPSALALGLSWLLCYVLTTTDVFPTDPEKPSHHARTDIKLRVLEEVDWFFVPYPGRYGWPTVGVGIFAAFLGSVAVSAMESIGDYYAHSRACQVPPPPKHAVSRGVAVEGLLSMLCGACGTCLGTTSFSSVAGIISVTGMGCRMGWQIVGLVFMVAGVAGKLGAALAVVPEPVIGGFNIIGVGMIIAMGLSCLQFVNLRSVRNLLVLAASFVLGLIVPQYMKSNPGVIDTGSEELDQVLTLILSTSMTVGGVTSFVLDNIFSGSADERGLLTSPKVLRVKSGSGSVTTEEELKAAYDLPLVSDMLRRIACCRHVPFLPAYEDKPLLPRVQCQRRRSRHSPGGADVEKHLTVEE